MLFVHANTGGGGGIPNDKETGLTGFMGLVEQQHVGDIINGELCFSLEILGVRGGGA